MKALESAEEDCSSIGWKPLAATAAVAVTAVVPDAKKKLLVS